MNDHKLLTSTGDCNCIVIKKLGKMSYYLQVLATDSIDSSACIALFTDSHRFLFNCGEGIQRLCVEHKVRLSKIRALLFTDFSPQNSFGLPGAYVTRCLSPTSLILICFTHLFRTGFDSRRCWQHQHPCWRPTPAQVLPAHYEILHEAQRWITELPHYHRTSLHCFQLERSRHPDDRLQG